MKVETEVIKAITFLGLIFVFPTAVVMENTKGVLVIAVVIVISFLINNGKEWWIKSANQIRSCLIEQIKRNGLEEEILIASYKSLFLIHYNYCAASLSTAIDSIKLKTSSFQNRIRRGRIMGRHRELAAQAKSEIEAVEKLVELPSDKKVRRLLSRSSSTRTESFDRSSSSFSLSKKLSAPDSCIPSARKRTFSHSPVLKTLWSMRDPTRIYAAYIMRRKSEK